MRGAAPKSVPVTPQSMKPAARWTLAREGWRSPPGAPHPALAEPERSDSPRHRDPTPPPARVRKQVFQFKHATGFDPGGEALHRPFLVRDIGAALGQSLRPQD